jgi:hypothetical protein
MKDRLELVRSYSVEDLQAFLESRVSTVIPEAMQQYILQLNSASSIIHHVGTNLKKASDALMTEYPTLTRAQARGIYYDALEFFYMDEVISARAWDMIYADEFERLKGVAIGQEQCMTAFKCLEKAHELRTKRRESMDYDWTPPVFLISTSVKPESLGYKSQKLMDIAKRHEDKEYREMIMSLETTAAEKERLLREAGIEVVIEDETPEDHEI